MKKPVEHRCWSRPCKGSKKFPLPTQYKNPDLITREQAVELYQKLDGKAKRKRRQVEKFVKDSLMENPEFAAEELPEGIVVLRDQILELEGELHKLRSQFPGCDR